MINIKQTIYQSIVDKIYKMQKLADYENANLRAIISLIILDDLIEWGKSKEESNDVIRQLIDLQLSILNNNKDLELVMDDSQSRVYTNVNLPQTNTTWARL